MLNASRARKTEQDNHLRDSADPARTGSGRHCLDDQELATTADRGKESRGLADHGASRGWLGPFGL